MDGIHRGRVYFVRGTGPLQCGRQHMKCGLALTEAFQPLLGCLAWADVAHDPESTLVGSLRIFNAPGADAYPAVLPVFGDQSNLELIVIEVTGQLLLEQGN